MKFIKKNDYSRHIPQLREYIFEEPNNDEWIVSFVATVPYDGENPMIYGDLFLCRILDIDADSIPISKGTPEEEQIIIKLEQWVRNNYADEEVKRLKNGLFSRMTVEMSMAIDILCFISALRNRHEMSKI